MIVKLLIKLEVGHIGYYTFDISGVSRALLQEHVRHDDGMSISVKSTRYTLKELKAENVFLRTNEDFGSIKDRASKYVVLTGIPEIDSETIKGLDSVAKLLREGYSNDKVKYVLPEAYKTSFIWTVPKSTLRNYLYLRDSKEALWEIRELAQEIKRVLKENNVKL